MFAATSILAGTAGCSTLLAVRGQQELARETAIVSGTITRDHVATGPILRSDAAAARLNEILADLH